MTDKLLVAHDRSVCTITFNRPAILNAIDREMMVALRAAAATAYALDS